MRKMILNKQFKLFTLQIVFLLTACAHIPSKELKTFMQVDFEISKKNCDKSPHDEEDPCLFYKQVGSAVVVNRQENGVHVLTAGHICGGMREAIKDVQERTSLDVVDISSVTRSIDLSMHPIMSIVAEDLENDLCLLFVPGTKSLVAEISNDAQLYGDEVFSVSAARGFMSYYVVPYFSGHFSGGDSRYSIFTFPSAMGSSGGPIFNKDGEIVGIVSQIHKSFHHIVMSPSLVNIKKFVHDNLNDG